MYAELNRNRSSMEGMVETLLCSRVKHYCRRADFHETRTFFVMNWYEISWKPENGLAAATDTDGRRSPAYKAFCLYFVKNF